MPDALGQFAKAKYLNLETFRKTGTGVRTPVWFAQGDTSGQSAIFYIFSESKAGKVKRIRNNPQVRLAPCNFRGELRGAWVEGQAHFCAAEEAALAQQFLRRKYGLQKIVGDFFSRLMGHQQTLIAVQLS